ncbi:MAG: hypothetical protein MEQ07_09510 [Aquimonas sp.]|nr:hypothetical protein [Aquimonas sp.]
MSTPPIDVTPRPQTMDQILALEGGRFGLLTPSATPSDTAWVLLNAGAIHRAGPFRLHVQLARQLAAAGFPTLRYDQPGIGDSLRPGERAPVELMRGVLDRLAEVSGARRFVVGGICSAADAGWRLAVADPRVCGLVLLDGMALRGPWYRLGQLQLLLRRPPGSWLGSLGKALRRSRGTADPMAQAAADLALRDWPTPAHARHELAALLQRKVRVYAHYTGGAANYFLHPGQFRASFGTGAGHAGVDFHYWREADHLFMQPALRERLIGQLRDWSCTQFGQPG